MGVPKLQWSDDGADKEPRHITHFHFGERQGGTGGKKGKRRMEGLTEAAAAAAGDGWSERMDREPDSHAQLSAGSKKERLTPGQRDMARERRRGDRKIESSFQIAAGLAVCTHRAFRVKVNRSFKSGTLFRTDRQPQRALSPSRPPGLVERFSSRLQS